MEDSRLKQQLYKLEKKLLQPKVRGSKMELTKLLGDDFIGIWKFRKSI